MAVVLLVEDSQGGTMAVRFSTAEEAREWEDKHPDTLMGLGVARLVTKAQALAEVA